MKSPVVGAKRTNMESRDHYPVPALVQRLDADEVPDFDCWPDDTTVGQVRDPFVDCRRCGELIRRLNSRLVEQSIRSDNE